MRRYMFVIPLVFIFGIFFLQCQQSQSEENQEKPNFLFILTDDLGWRDLSIFGSYFYETPNIDAIAAGGMRFNQAYASSPVCSPTRSSIMTGKNPARTDNTDWFGAPQPDNVERHWTRNKPLLPAPYINYMELEEKTIAESLKENGTVKDVYFLINMVKNQKRYASTITTIGCMYTLS